MSDSEIGALRAKLASRPRSDDYRQRRKDIDARGLAYRLAADIGVEPATANRVRAEWTATPDDVGEKISCGPSAKKHLDAIGKYVKAGFDHIILTQIGPQEDAFFDFFQRELKPALAAKRAA